MSITTASELQSATLAWANRSDLADRFPDTVALTEAKFNRRLRVRAMESTLASTPLVLGAVSLPAGFLAFKELRYDGSGGGTLEPRPIEWVRKQPNCPIEPKYFAVTNAEVVCWPTAGNITGTYYSSIPSLTNATSNWLLTAAPDLYLFGCLEQIAVYLRDTSLLEMASAQTEMLLQQVQGSDNANAINGGPLQVRVR